ncbi:MAG: glutamate-cysteine ligase family protein [Paralcaligenes sp.]
MNSKLTVSSSTSALKDGPRKDSVVSIEAVPGTKAYCPRIGLEMEMVVAHAQTCVSQPVETYFDALRSIKEKRGVACESSTLSGRCVGIETPIAMCGLDNGFNLLETSLAPVDGRSGGMQRMADLAHQELADTLDALKGDQACILNASQHPACPRDAHWYARVCVPRPIYEELRGYRGWHHWEGIDAKAQNGANTSVPINQAVDALNVAVALAPASIALFANSPIESGQVTGLKENRMTLWQRVFGPAKFSGDLYLCSYPERPFRDMGDFFLWMFGPGTVTRGLPPVPSYDYKGVATVLLDGDPCLLNFLQAPQWLGRRSDNNRVVRLVPNTHHFEYSQIAQFLDARLRYRFGALPPLPELMAAWRSEGGLEALFGAYDAQVYIEGRAPAAGFADACLLSEAGANVAQSVLLAPSALQAGLLANLADAGMLVKEWGWQRLGGLRQTAMRAGLDDAEVKALCADVLAVARAGLSPFDQRWLAYAEFIEASGRTGADRLLDTWESAGGTQSNRLAALLPRHAALHPDQFGSLPQQ